MEVLPGSQPPGCASVNETTGVNDDVDNLVDDDAGDVGEGGVEQHEEEGQEQQGDDAEDAVGEKRRRKRGAALARAKLDDITRKMAEKSKKIDELVARQPLLSAKDKKSLEKKIFDLKKLELQKVDAENNLVFEMAKEEAVAKHRAVKLARQADNEEAKLNMSEAGSCLLVELKIKYDSKFDNHTDKNDAVWEHVHADFIRAINDGRLPASDARSVDGLKHRCARTHTPFLPSCSHAVHGVAAAVSDGLCVRTGISWRALTVGAAIPATTTGSIVRTFKIR